MGDAHDAADVAVVQTHLVEDEEESIVGGLWSVFLLDAAERGEVDGLHPFGGKRPLAVRILDFLL